MILWPKGFGISIRVGRVAFNNIAVDGDVVLHVPASHTMHSVAFVPAGWLRCRTIQPEAWQSFYSASPRISRGVAAAGAIPSRMKARRSGASRSSR